MIKPGKHFAHHFTARVGFVDDANRCQRGNKDQQCVKLGGHIVSLIRPKRLKISGLLLLFLKFWGHHNNLCASHAIDLIQVNKNPSQ